MGSAWGFWKVRTFLSEPEEAPTHSRTTVPARDTGVTPGRAGRAFVPGAVLENVWSRESAHCLSWAPAASWQESWESPAKNQGESREQGHAGICAGRRGAGGKTGLKDDLHLQLCPEGSPPASATPGLSAWHIQRVSPAPGHGEGRGTCGIAFGSIPRAATGVTQHSSCFLHRENVAASPEMFLCHKQS